MTKVIWIRSAPPSRQVLLTRRQVAELLGVSVSCLEKWAERETGPRFYRNGFHKQAQSGYRIEDIEQFVRERCGDDAVATVGK